MERYYDNDDDDGGGDDNDDTDVVFQQKLEKHLLDIKSDQQWDVMRM